MIPNKRTIAVKGIGTVKKAPDIFGISFTINGHEWKYSDAMATLNRRVEELRKTVEGRGLDRKLLKTTSFDIRTDSIYTIRSAHHYYRKAA